MVLEEKPFEDVFKMASILRHQKKNHFINSESSLLLPTKFPLHPTVWEAVLFYISRWLSSRVSKHTTISVGILTFISMINKTSESLKARQVFIFQHFSIYEQ